MNDDERKTSDYLKVFVLRPAPLELRPKVLAAAGGSRPSVRFMTSIQWGIADVFVLLIFGALVGDSILSGKQARRLDTLMDDRPPADFIRDADLSKLEELVGSDVAKYFRFQLTRPYSNRTDAKEGRID